MLSKIVIKIQENNNEVIKYYLLNQSQIKHLKQTDNGLFEEEVSGEWVGFCYNNHWILKKYVALWEEVSFNIINIIENYYGYGQNKVTALINGKTIDLISSYWDGNTNCYIPIKYINFNFDEYIC